MTCVDPISWLRLEQWALPTALGGSTIAERAAIDAHLDTCAACRACADSLRADVVVLRPLVMPTRAARVRWWRLAPVFAFAGAALIALFMLRARPSPPDTHDTRDETIARVKGIGAVVLGVVRDRAGAIRDDVTTYASGDRWKVIVTCPPGAAAWIDVAILDGASTDYPLAPARVACGNKIVVPGAFAITGAADNRVCVRVGASTPRRTTFDGGDDTACVTLRAERP